LIFLSRFTARPFQDSQHHYEPSSSTLFDLNKYSVQMYVPNIHRTTSQSHASDLISGKEIRTSLLPTHRRISDEVMSDQRNNNESQIFENTRITNNNDITNDHNPDPTDADDATDGRNKVNFSSRTNPPTNNMESANTNKGADRFVSQVLSTTQMTMSTSVISEPATASTSVSVSI
jgi:hypothetical protein